MAVAMGAAAWVAFAAASAIGGVVRWWVKQTIDARPAAHGRRWGTVAVNVAGSFVLAVVVAAARNGQLSATAVAVAGGGFCGSLTTFSTFAVEALDEADRDGRRAGAGWVVVSVLAPLAAAGLGMIAAAVLWA